MQKIEQSKTITLYEGVDFSLALEYNNTTAIIHLGDVKKFTPSSFKKLQEVKNSLRPFLADMGYPQVFAGIHKGNVKTKKLAMMSGFKYIGSQQGLDIYILGEG